MGKPCHTFSLPLAGRDTMGQGRTAHFSLPLEGRDGVGVLAFGRPFGVQMRYASRRWHSCGGV